MQSTTMRPQASALPSAAKGRQAVKVMAVSAPEKPSSNAPAVPAGETRQSRGADGCTVSIYPVTCGSLRILPQGDSTRLQWPIGLILGNGGERYCKNWQPRTIVRRHGCSDCHPRVYRHHNAASFCSLHDPLSWLVSLLPLERRKQRRSTPQRHSALRTSFPSRTVPNYHAGYVSVCSDLVQPSTNALLGATCPILPPSGLNKYSSRITQPKYQGASQAMLYATGLKESDMSKPQVCLDHSVAATTAQTQQNGSCGATGCSERTYNACIESKVESTTPQCHVRIPRTCRCPGVHVQPLSTQILTAPHLTTPHTSSLTSTLARHRPPCRLAPRPTQVGISSVWYEGNPCNMHLMDLAAEVKKGVEAMGMVGYRFNTIGVSDGISMGTDGMSFSLQVRPGRRGARSGGGGAGGAEHAWRVAAGAGRRTGPFAGGRSSGSGGAVLTAPCGWSTGYAAQVA